MSVDYGKFLDEKYWGEYQSARAEIIAHIKYNPGASTKQVLESLKLNSWLVLYVLLILEMENLVEGTPA